LHRVGRVLSFFSSRRNLDSPTPLAANDCAPPPHPLVCGGKGTLACGRGVGGVTIPTRGHTLWCSINIYKYIVLNSYVLTVLVGRKGVFYLYKWLLPAFKAPRGVGGGSAPCGAYSYLLNLRNLALLVHHAIFAGILHCYKNIRRFICNIFALKLLVSIFTKEYQKKDS
jgi:hypothetical protein